MEKKARDIRYYFFAELIKEYKYERLFTAHQLNDKLEWFLMQLSKGAGLSEILGLNLNEKKENYYLSRPLLDYTKETLENYLEKNKIKYFIDESNIDTKYTRNIIRKKFSNDFIKSYEQGVRKSFSYLKEDLNSLNIDLNPIKTINKLEIFKNLNDDNLNIRVIDKSLKKRGILLSSKQRIEILKQKEIVISHKISISITNQMIYISPKVTIVMNKKFKDKCRILKIPNNLREYIFVENIDLNLLSV